MTPLVRRVEEAFSDRLPGGQHCLFNADKLYRMTPAEETELHAARIAAGIETVDEARQAMGLAARGEA